MSIDHKDLQVRNEIIKSIQKKYLGNHEEGKAIIRVNYEGVIISSSTKATTFLKEYSDFNLESSNSIFNLIPTEDLKLFVSKFMKALAGKITYYSLLNTQGNPHLNFRISAVYNKIGAIENVDILLSNSLLDRNQKVENKLREILENASIGILLTKPLARILDSNKAANEMLGYTAAEIKNLTREDLFDSKNPELDRFFENRTAQGHASGEFIALKKDGSELPVQIYSTIYENEEKELLTSTIIIDISDKKESEIDLIKTTHVLESLFNRHPDAVYSFDLEGKFISINNSGLELSEGNLEEILNHNFEAMIPNEDLPKVWEHFQKAAQGEIQNYDANFISYKGTKKKINITNFPIVSNNEITGVFGIARDITIVEENKRKVRESENKYKNILDQSLDIICTISKYGDFIEVSAASKEIWGYAPEELAGVNFSKIIYPQDIQKTQHAWRDSVNGLIVTNFSNRYVHKEGRIVPVIWSVKWNDLEQIMYCVAKDASQIELAQQKIVEDRNMLRAIIDNIPDYIFVINSNHETILTNKKFYSEYLGKTSEKETLNLQPIDYFSLEEGKEIMMDNQKVMESGIPVINREDKIHDHNGEMEVISLSKVPFKSQDKIIGLVGIGRNITETYNLQQEQKLIHHLIEIINEAENYKAALLTTINKIKEYFNFHSSEAWEVGYSKKAIRLISNVQDLPDTINSTLKKEYNYGEGLPGATWKEQDVKVYKDFISREFSEDSINYKLAIGVPVNVEDETIAVFTFFSNKDKNWDEDLSIRISRIVYQISSSIQRKSAEGQLNNMFNYSPNLIAIIGTDGFLKEVNPAFKKVFGYEREEMLNTPFKNFLHPDEIEVAIKRLEKVANGRLSESFQNRCLSKDGIWRWISWTPSNIIEERGIIYLFGIDITPIKSANLELLKYKNIIESSKNGVGLIDIQTQEVFLNSELKKLLGRQASKINSLQAVKAMYGDPKLVEDVFTKLHAGEYWDGDIKLIGRNGAMHDFHLNAGPVYNENLELVAFYALHTDISDRKLHEAALSKYNNQINNILESITDGFFSIDRDWKITYWNSEAERLLNMPKHVILNRNIKDYKDLDHSILLFSKMEEAFKESKKISYEEYLNSTDQWFEVNIYLSTEGLSIYFKDITSRRKVDEEIRIAKERYDLVSRATQEAIYDWDIQKNVLEWSEAYYSIFGNERKSVPETLLDWESHLHEDDKAEVINALDDALNSNDAEWFQEYRLIKSNNEVIYVLERGYIIRDANNNAIRMIGSLQDITIIKKNERELEELNSKLLKRAQDLKISNQELEQFAYIASHDLQEPLRMVTSFLGQLKKKYEDQLDEKAQQYIYFATDGAVRMRQIILDLLEYSRVGRLNYQMESIDLNLVLEEIKFIHQNIISEKNAEISYTELPTIQAAKTPLLRVLSNLISNALKYQEENNTPKIEVKVIDFDDRWEFVVLDNGIGVNSQFFDKIFIIFQRLHAKDNYSGTGIGLAISKKIIENHGGEIWLESEEGIGSEFHFTIKKQF